MGSDDALKATGQLHRLGQSLWLDNITRDLLTGGHAPALHRRSLGHRADLEPDDLRAGDQEQLRLRPGDRGPARAGHSRVRICSSSSRSRTSRTPPICFDPSTIGPTAWTAGCRSRCRRCWRTTPPRRSRRQRICSPGRSSEPDDQDPGDDGRVCPRLKRRSSPEFRSTSRCSSHANTTSRRQKRSCAASSAASMPG